MESPHFLRDTIASLSKSSKSPGTPRSYIRSQSSIDSRANSARRSITRSRSSIGDFEISTSSLLPQQHSQRVQSRMNSSNESFESAESPSNCVTLKRNNGRNENKPGLKEKNLNVDSLPAMMDYGAALEKAKTSSRNKVGTHESIQTLEVYTQENMRVLFENQQSMSSYIQEMHRDIQERMSELTRRVRMVEGGAKTGNKVEKRIDWLNQAVEELDKSLVPLVEKTVEQEKKLEQVEQVGNEANSKTRQVVETILQRVEKMEESFKSQSEIIEKELNRIEKTFKADVWYLDDVISEVEDGLKWVVGQVSREEEEGSSVYSE